MVTVWSKILQFESKSGYCCKFSVYCDQDNHGSKMASKTVVMNLNEPFFIVSMWYMYPCRQLVQLYIIEVAIG